MKHSLCKVGLALFGTTIACPAFADSSTPSMTFMSLPAIAEPGAAQSQPAWSRHGETMIVVVKSPAQCGQRAQDPSFAISNGTLQLDYTLATAPGAAQDCVATQIFTLKNLRDPELRIAANARSEPIMVAQTPAQAPAPPLTFVGVPAAPVGDLDQGWMYQQRDRDTVLVIAREPAECGQRPVEPWIEVRDGKVNLGYKLPVTLKPDVVQDCASTAIITVRNLSDREHEVSMDTQLKPIEAAAEPNPETAVVMDFMAVPAFATTDTGEQRIFHYKDKASDKAVVVVRDRADCGQRPAAPAFAYRDGLLRLQYTLPALGTSSQADKPCASAAIFTFRNLSSGELRVAANAVRREPTSLSFNNEAGQMDEELQAAPNAMSRR